MGIETEPFKDREHMVAEIRKCAMASTVFSGLAILFALIGVVADLINETLGLETMNWFLFAIFAAVMSLMPHMHVVSAKHLLGTEIFKK